MSPGRLGVQALGVITPLTVRSTLLAANADEVIASSRALLSRDIRIFISIFSIAGWQMEARAGQRPTRHGRAVCRVALSIFSRLPSGKPSLFWGGPNLARGWHVGNTTNTTLA